MKLSILVTFYNQAAFVDETLGNILGMHYEFDYEILVGDDGSSDNTVELVNKWIKKYPNITCYQMPRDKNKKYNSIERAALNRSHLLKHAKGEYVAFLDGDDFYCDQDKFIDSIKMLDENKNLAAVASNCFMYWNEEKKELFNKEKKSRVYKTKDYWRYKYFHISTFVFRNPFADKEIDFNIKAFDDNYIAFVFLKNGDLYYFNKPTTCYRQCESSLWHDSDEIDQNITNLIDYQFEIEYNPALKKESLIRHLKEFDALKKAHICEHCISEKTKMRLESVNVDIFKLIDTKIGAIKAKIFFNKVSRVLKGM